MAPFRLAILNSHPIQYFAPFYAFLTKHWEGEVTVLYCSNSSLRGAIDPGFGRTVKWDLDLLDGYKAVFLGPRASRRTPGAFWSLVCPEVWAELRSGRYDAVLVHGYNYAATILALAAAKSVALPVMMRSEARLGLRRSPRQTWIRDAILARAYRHVDAFLTIGSQNAEYYRSLGVPESKLFSVPYAVDNERFITQSAPSGRDRATTRERYGLPKEGPVVLYASKLTRRKHPDAVIRALASMRLVQPATLLMVGSGELEPELRALAASTGLRDVVFAGFVNQTELPALYAASDVFVLVSDNEPWGLVVNEVMCAGLPVIVSSDVGCVDDLVHDGVNGHVVAVGDATALESALKQILCDEERRGRMGAASREIIGGWGYEEGRRGLEAAIAAIGVHRPNGPRANLDGG